MPLMITIGIRGRNERTWRTTSNSRGSGEKVVADDKAKLEGCRTQQNYRAFRAVSESNVEAGSAQDSSSHPQLRGIIIDQKYLLQFDRSKWAGLARLFHFRKLAANQIEGFRRFAYPGQPPARRRSNSADRFWSRFASAEA